MKDPIGDRIKSYYESVYNNVLPMRMPIILRLDGISFSNYTKGCAKPFDKKLMDAMDKTALYLCDKIQNAKIAYVQSDEISILITPYTNLNTKAWFDNKLNKILSASASYAGAYLTSISSEIFGKTKLAAFDARAFVVPKEEVNNVFLWRQLDCSRNSVQMLAQSLYSHKELHGKSSSELQEMTFAKGSNWNSLPTSYRRGRCVRKVQFEHKGVNTKTKEEVVSTRSKWEIDLEIPKFNVDTNYIDQYVFIPEEVKE